MKKFNFKQISAVLASAMLGITGIAAMAAAYPQPMVVGTTGDFAVVYGSDAATSDQTQATSIATQLQNMVSSSAVIGTDSVKLRTDNNEFNIGEATNDFITTIEEDELGEILKDGVFKDDGNDEYDYEQEIAMEPLMLTHFSDSDFNDEVPVLGFEILDGTDILTYTLDFKPDNAESDTADWNEFEGSTIEMLGKEYYILSASNATAGSETLTLLDSASSSTLSGDDTVTIEAGGTSYQVSIAYIDADEVKLTINGETTNSLNEDDTYKLDSGDYIGIKDIGFQGISGGDEMVEFSIGSGKIELVNGEEVEINGEDVSDIDEYEGHKLTAAIAENGETLDSIGITWTADEDMWLAFDTSSKVIEMPAFGKIQLSVGDFVTDAEEVTKIEPDSDSKFKLTTTVTDGDVSFNFLYLNTTGTGFGGIGKDSDELLETSDGAYVNWSENSKWFIATWYNGVDHESYVLEVSDIDDSTPADNTTRIESVASTTGSKESATMDVGDFDDIGNIRFTLDSADEELDRANFTVTAVSGGTISLSYLITAEGMKIQLPFDSITSTSDGVINITGFAASASASAAINTWNMNLSEEDKDGNPFSGAHTYATLSINTDSETQVSAIDETLMSGGADIETEDGSKDYVGYLNSSLATKTLLKDNDDQDELEVTYHGTEAYAEVFLSSTDASSDGLNLGNVLVTDAQISAVQGRNLIVVGGSAVNEVAATLVGVTYPTYSDSWTAATGVGTGQLLIQSFTNPYQSGKVAILVAGYEAADTAAGAQRLINNPSTIDTTVGNKYVYSTDAVEGTSTLVSGP